MVDIDVVDHVLPLDDHPDPLLEFRVPADVREKLAGGIDRARMAGVLEHRQVAVRVAVRVALGQVDAVLVRELVQRLLLRRTVPHRGDLARIIAAVVAVVDGASVVVEGVFVRHLPHKGVG